MRSILSAYDAANDLEAYGEQLAGVSILGPAPTPVHIAAVEILDRLMSMSEQVSGDATPPQVRMLTRMLKVTRPILLDSFAKVDPAVIVEFMTDLRNDIQHVIDQGTPGAGGRGLEAAVTVPALEGADDGPAPVVTG